jgi:hypothetical protein
LVSIARVPPDQAFTASRSKPSATIGAPFIESARIEIIVMSGTNRPRAVRRQIARMVLRQARPFVGRLLEGYGGLYHAEREARFEGEATE